MPDPVLSQDGLSLISPTQVEESVASLQKKHDYFTALIARYTDELAAVDAKIATAVALGYGEE